jgi:hypothetical protein
MAIAKEEEKDMDLLKVSPLARTKPTFYDPKEKRSQFFRLERGDTEQLVSFLNTVGLFASATSLLGSQRDIGSGVKHALTETASGDLHSVPYSPVQSVQRIWRMRDFLVGGLKASEELGDVCDFQTRIVRESSSPKVVIATATLLDALLLSIVIDRVRKAKVQKCARPDCGIVFTSDNRHEKKYCCRYCAHVESVRGDRERKKLLKASQKG